MAIARLIEKITSSGVMTEPSLNLTPLRSVKRIWVGLISFQLVASCGSGLKVLLL